MVGSREPLFARVPASVRRIGRSAAAAVRPGGRATDPNWCPAAHPAHASRLVLARDRIDRHFPRDERGQSVTVFFAVVVTALLLVCGLVVDGGRQAAAAREAQGVAAAVARAAAEAAAADAIAGGDGATVGRATGGRLLAAAGMAGTVTPVGGGIRVDTATSVPTVFLSLIGISSLPARGSATASSQAVR